MNFHTNIIVRFGYLHSIDNAGDLYYFKRNRWSTVGLKFYSMQFRSLVLGSVNLLHWGGEKLSHFWNFILLACWY